MAEYRVIVNFKDLQDNGYFYTVGDTFPREGKKVSKKRITELLTDANRRKTPMIEAVETEDKAEE